MNGSGPFQGRLSRIRSGRAAAKGHRKTASRRRRRAGPLWIALALASLVTLTGCWDMLPIEDLGFANLIYVDRSPDGRVHTEIELTNPTDLPQPGGGGPSSGGPSSGGGGGGGGGGGQSSTPAFEIKSSGINLAQALRAADLRSINRLYTGHIQVLLVGEGEAKADLSDALDYFERDAKSRVIQWVYIVDRSDVRSVMSQLTVPAQGYPANAIALFSLHMESASNVRPVRLYQLVSALAAPERDVAIPVLAVACPGQTFTIKAVALFRGPHLVGTLSVPDAVGLVWIRRQVRFEDFAVPCPSHPSDPAAAITLQAMGDGAKVKAVFTQSPSGQRLLTGLDVHLFSMARVSQSPAECPINYAIAAQRDRVSQAAAQTVLNVVSHSVEQAQKMKSDPFGFGTAVRIADPGLWTRIAPDWADRLFPSLPITIHVRIRLDDTGGLYRPL